MKTDSDLLGEIIAKQGEQIGRLQEREKQLTGKIILLDK
jgi:hypothetical protein